MNILMIGNGFDLEHGLPTKYTDFLNFVKDFHKAYLSANSVPKRLGDIKDEYLRLIFENCEFYNRADALYLFTKDNLWIEYFNKVLKEHLVNKENWIDFESEISSIIRAFDDLIKYYESVEIGHIENTKLEEYYKDRLSKILDIYSLNLDVIKNNIPILLSDLNKLIGALEIYIWDYIGGENIKYFNPDIEQIHPDKVFSFNYSDTYSRVYAYNRNTVEYSFVHGKAKNNLFFFNDIKNASDEEKAKFSHIYAEKNNMVLGIDEYLPIDIRSKEIDFIEFKKYYQRIYKINGNEHKNWLHQIKENFNSGRKEENILFIFGHSLDDTDADILKEFITNEYIKTVVYYKDKKQLGQQIANLVKILTSDKVIEKVYGNNPSISFCKQKDRELIKGSSFEITTDTMQLENVYRWNRIEAKALVYKITNKISKMDLKYFHSQKAVITLFDIMQKNGLTKRYAKQLLEIANELRKNEGLREPEQYDTEYWSRQDYDNSYGCDQLTQKFINAINIYNKNNFILQDTFLQSYEEELEEYQKLIDDNKIIDKDEYIKIIYDIIYMFYDKDDNSEKLWNILLKISIGPGEAVAQDTLEEIIELSDDDVDIIRYNHLLSEIQMNEYFDFMAEKFGENYE